MAPKKGFVLTENQRRTLFKPGECPNPGGKPKAIREVIEHAKGNVPKTMELLFEIASDNRQRTSDRIAAIKEYHDRALGKPPQALQHSGNITTHEDALKAIADDLDALGEEGKAETIE